MKPEALKLQRELALKKIAEKRANAEGPHTDRVIADLVAREVRATTEQVLKWMREAGR